MGMGDKPESVTPRLCWGCWCWLERGSAFRPVMDIGCWLLTLFAIVVGPGPASTEAEAEALDMVVAADIRALVEVGPSASKWRRDDGA